MRRRTKVRATLVPLGVDIIDRDGQVLAGITNLDAIHLLASLIERRKTIKRRALSDGDRFK